MKYVKSRKETVVVRACSVVPDSFRPMDCSPLGSSVHGTSQTRILEWVAISFSSGSSRPRDRTHVSCVFWIGRQIIYHCMTWEVEGNKSFGQFPHHTLDLPGMSSEVGFQMLKTWTTSRSLHPSWQHNISAYGASIMWPQDVCISELTTRKAREHFFSWQTLT